MLNFLLISQDNYTYTHDFSKINEYTCYPIDKGESTSKSKMRQKLNSYCICCIRFHKYTIDMVDLY